MATGIFGKVGAILSSIPDPVVGGAMLVTFGLVISVALTNLQFVDMKSGRNLIILGTSLMMGVLIPTWAKSTEQAINTGGYIISLRDDGVYSPEGINTKSSLTDN